MATYTSGREPTILLGGGAGEKGKRQKEKGKKAGGAEEKGKRQKGKGKGKREVPGEVEQRVRELAERVAGSHGVQIWDVELRGGGRHRMLRVYIEKTGGAGVTHTDCEGVSRELGTLLDVEEAVPGGSYVLEVSSPGLDRKLVTEAQYRQFAGSRVRLVTRQPVGGQRHFEGRLESVEAGRLRLAPSAGRKQEAAAETVEIDIANVEKANVVPEY